MKSYFHFSNTAQSQIFTCLLSICIVLLSVSNGTAQSVATQNTAEPSSQWQFGTARVDITPKEPMWMAGYASRTHVAEATMTKLWAKAIALQAGEEKPLVMVTLDLVGIEYCLSQGVIGRIQKELDLPRENIVLNVSHTHSGPVVGFNLRPMHYLALDKENQQRVLDYSRTLADSIVAISKQAVADLQPGTIQWGNGHADFAVNRRENRPESDVPNRRLNNALVGPVDHSVPILAIYDSEETCKAILFGYACHATVLSGYEWSGDYPGFAQMELENRFPECQAMFWAGCGGDQNPIPRRSQELAEHYGRELAVAVESVLRTSELKTVPAKYVAKFEQPRIKLEPPPNREQVLLDSQSKNQYIARRAQMFLNRLDAGLKLADSYPYPIQLWNLGDEVDWIFLGGEVVVDYAVRIKSERHDEQTWVAGYSNDVMAYIPSRRVLLEGGYEGADAMIYYGLPNRWDESIEQSIIDTVQSSKWNFGK